MNSLVRDAYLLVATISDSLSPRDKWAIVNIAKSENRVFSFPAIKAIPLSFGYAYDGVPKFLEEEGVIKAKVKGRWFIGVTHDSTSGDVLRAVARKEKYIKKSQGFEFYWRWYADKSDYGPELGGQFAVLIDMRALRRFLNYYGNLSPRFSLGNKELSFLGETVEFKGDVEAKSVQLLVENINLIVDKKDFYEIPRGKKDKFGHSPEIRDKLKKVFMAIKKKIYSNRKLKDTLVLVQHDGFGMFVNQKILRNS